MGRVQTHNRSTDLGSCTRTAAHHLKAIRCLLSCARLLPCRHPSVHLYDSSSLAAAGLTSQLIALRDVWNAYGRCTAAGDAITYLTLGLDLDLAYPLVRALHNVCVCGWTEQQRCGCEGCWMVSCTSRRAAKHDSSAACSPTRSACPCTLGNARRLQAAGVAHPFSPRFGLLTCSLWTCRHE